MRILTDAVDASNSGVTAVALLQQRMAHVCIREGLLRAAHGFQLTLVPLYKFDVDAAFQSAKAASRFASSKLTMLMNCTEIWGFSIVKLEYKACVAIDITTVIPNPSSEVRSLLPSVAWPDYADSASSGSSSVDLLTSPSREDASAGLELQTADPQLDPVYSILALLPLDVATVIHQQLRLSSQHANAG